MMIMLREWPRQICDNIFIANRMYNGKPDAHEIWKLCGNLPS